MNGIRTWFVLGLLGTFGFSIASSATPPSESSSWNAGWDFILESSSDQAPWPVSQAMEQKDWETVNLPHYGHLEPYNVSKHFQGFCWYRKVFTPEDWMKGKRVTLEFEGAMEVAQVYLDGQHILTHEGGYLPFTIDLTKAVALGKPTTILVGLDNRDNPEVPPGKPLGGVDFCYFTGIYRNVRLHVTDPVHITDDVAANEVAGGGIFVRDAAVSDAEAQVSVSTEVGNDSTSTRRISIVTQIIGADGGIATTPTPTSGASIHAGEKHTFEENIKVAHPKLWSPDHPNLYNLLTLVMDGDKVIQTSSRQIGIRSLRNDPKLGFFLNGQHLVPSGANRHQAYPYVGNALSDEAQYRDAVKLKEAGFQIIRLSHYPQSPAFLNACDQLGLLTIVCIPGWQFFNDTDHFKNNVEQNLRDTIRRDRNHPSCILWETSLNETDGHDEFFRHLVEVAHEEYPGNQMLTCGDTEGHNYDAIRYDVPYSGWDGATRTRPDRAHGASSFHREYGDNQFGGYSRYTRGDGEKLMLIQAWNFQTALNVQNQLPYTWGQCTWEGIDNNRGFNTEIATCGVLDPFRLPKFLHYFYQSQRDPRILSPNCDLGPMVFIANYWTPQSPSPVIVYSNADEVELFVNGQSVGRQKPDHGLDVPFGDASGFDLNYWKSGVAVPRDVRNKTVDSPVFNGGNAQALVHPPFTFSGVKFAAGELKAVAYLNGQPVATTVRRTPGTPKRLVLSVDYSRKQFVASGADLLFIRAEVQDDHGTIVPDASPAIKYEVEGPATIIGDNPRAAEAGISTLLLRSTTLPGTIKIRAQAGGLEEAATTLDSVKAD